MLVSAWKQIKQSHLQVGTITIQLLLYPKCTMYIIVSFMYLHVQIWNTSLQLHEWLLIKKMVRFGKIGRKVLVAHLQNVQLIPCSQQPSLTAKPSNNPGAASLSTTTIQVASHRVGVLLGFVLEFGNSNNSRNDETPKQ